MLSILFEAVILHLWNTFVDSAKTSEVHLIGAVEHDDILAKGFTHVFGGLSLASTGGSSRGTTHGHTQGLGQRDVTPASQMWGIMQEYKFMENLVLEKFKYFFTMIILYFFIVSGISYCSTKL